MATIASIVRIISTKRSTTALALGGIQVETGHDGGIAARVEGCGSGGTLAIEVTRLEGETDWIIDAAYIDGCPAYANGEGARYCKVRAVADKAIVAKLDAAAEGL